MAVRKHATGPRGLQPPLLPEGSGDAESPAWLRRHVEAYANGLIAAHSDPAVGKRRVRRAFSDYTAKNCEEAYGLREAGPPAWDEVGGQQHQ